MSGRRMNRTLCAAAPRGAVTALEQLGNTVDERDADAIAVVGDLGGHPVHRRYGLRALADARPPRLLGSRPGGRPVDVYLQDAFSIETVFTPLRSVHGTAASGPGNVVFAGFGGEISDGPGTLREEQAGPRYPRWEPQYRLTLLAELVNTHRPRLVVAGGEPAVGVLGRAVRLAPGDLGDGHYAVADLHRRHAEIHELGLAAR
jgi:hypothetical protein